jgi:hypothetical protein
MYFLKLNWIAYLALLILTVIIPILFLPSLYKDTDKSKKEQLIDFYRSNGLALILGSIILLTLFILVFQQIYMNWSYKMAILGFISLIAWAIFKLNKLTK